MKDYILEQLALMLKTRPNSEINKTLDHFKHIVGESKDSTWTREGSSKAEVIAALTDKTMEYIDESMKKPKPPIPDRSTKPKFTEQVEARRAELANQQTQR